MSSKDQKEIIEGPYYIHIKKYQFESFIKKNQYIDYIHIGTPRFRFCIEIAIQKKDNLPIKGKLVQLKSEPECGIPTLLEKGDFTLLIHVTFLFCKALYPSIHVYEFDDESHIDCGIQPDNSMPPRKTIKPLSLAYLSIATYGQTWYERQFHAMMINSDNYKIYRDSIQNLDAPISNTFLNFGEFIRKYYLNSYLQENLEPYFKVDETWFTFFKSIPKSQQCDLFYNWLPSCVSDILGDSYRTKGWFIPIDTLKDVGFRITNNPITKGGRFNTRKRRKVHSYFSNQSGE
jgi:hypothetical protein